MMQSFYRLLQRAALRGMNYGGGGHPETSGERHLLKRLARLWPHHQALCFIDAGANKGDYTALVADIFKKHSPLHVWSLEPAREPYAQLQKTIARLAQPERFTALPVGLGERDEHLSLYAAHHAEQSGLTSVYPRRLDHFGIELKKTETVHLLPLDMLAVQHGIEHIHFLKLDLEGHELAALQGATGLLAEKRIDAIQFEFGGCNIDSRTYFQDFFYKLSADFLLYRILRHGLEPIKAYKEEHEIFTTTNYLALRKGFTLPFA